MATRAVPFFLPLHRATLEAMLAGVVPRSVTERAALVVLATQLRTPMTFQQIDRMLMDVQAMLEAGAPEEGESAIRGVWAKVELSEAGDIVDALAASNVVLAPTGPAWDSQQLARYDSEFQDLCRDTPDSFEIPVASTVPEEEEDEFPEDQTVAHVAPIRFSGLRDQAVAVRVLASALDEHVSIDGYAGTGKTFLILLLQNHLDHRFTYVAPRHAHLAGVRGHSAGAVREGMRTLTLSRLATSVASEYQRSSGIRLPTVGPSELSAAQRAQRADITAIGDHSAEKVVQLVERAVRRWCEGAAVQVQDHHFNRLLPFHVDKWPYVLAARRYVANLYAPDTPSGTFPVTTSHIVKWMAAHGVQIPTYHGTLLVDEAHDLLPSWRDMLLRYPGGVVLMGDPLQNLQARASRPERTKHVGLYHSYRMGMNGEAAVEYAVELAPERAIEMPFSGSRGHITRLRYWKGRDEDLRDGLRVYANEWALLADAQRLFKEGARFRLLESTELKLKSLVTQALKLYGNKGGRGAWMAGGHGSWESLASAMEKAGQRKVVEMFERGYNQAKFAEMLAGQAPEGEQRISLGLMADVKNLEASAVSLSPCCFGEDQIRQGWMPAHATYLAMTRARDELWLPGGALDRLKDLQSAAMQRRR